MKNLHKISDGGLTDEELAVLWSAQTEYIGRYPKFRKISGILETFSRASGIWFPYKDWGYQVVLRRWLALGKPQPDISVVQF